MHLECNQLPRANSDSWLHIRPGETFFLSVFICVHLWLNILTGAAKHYFVRKSRKPRFAKGPSHFPGRDCRQASISAHRSPAFPIRAAMVRSVNVPGPTSPRSISSHVHGADTGAPGFARTA
jgi:hypothetical protein